MRTTYESRRSQWPALPHGSALDARLGTRLPGRAFLCERPTMCDRCALIDYPIAECWRPCYVPPVRRSAHPVPGRIYNQDDFEAQQTIETLRIALKASQREASKLRFQVEHLTAKHPAQIAPSTVPE